jgi:S1-C subfamily serine protease
MTHRYGSFKLGLRGLRTAVILGLRGLTIAVMVMVPALGVLSALGIWTITGTGKSKKMETPFWFEKEYIEKIQKSVDSLNPELIKDLPAVRGVDTISPGAPRAVADPPHEPRPTTTEPLPPELLLVRAQPSVFRINSWGTVEIRYPRSASAAMAALERAYDAERRALEPGARKSDYFWVKVATDPATYLQASDDRATKVEEDAVCVSGTGFAVSREGILLTNAHVVADPIGPLDPNDLETAFLLLREPIEALRDRLAKDFGGECPLAQRPRVLPRLIHWMATQSTVKGTFKRAEVVLKYDREWRRSFDRWLANNLDDLGYNALINAGPLRPFAVAATVLERGTSYPGKDVAVLRVSAPNDVKGEKPLFYRHDMRDRLICLPLGDSDDVLPGTRIVSMGFPDRAFNPSVMDPSAQFLVSSREGLLSQPKRMKGGWDYFEMAVYIDHGDSGGPVLLHNGDVIALNVGIANEDLRGLTLSVPINIAKEYLAKAGITPDPGPLTRLWEEGLQLYASGRYRAAHETFIQVSNWQEEGQSLAIKTTMCINPAVVEMETRSLVHWSPPGGSK